MLKQIACVRRRATLTKKEFFDYHFQQHGKLSQGPKDEESPAIYYQTHFFDTLYFAKDPKARNATSCFNPAWCCHDDMTELYFNDEDHIDQVFSSEYVKTVVGPDGANFNDFSAVIPIFVKERIVSLPWADSNSSSSLLGSTETDGFNANLFIAPVGGVSGDAITDLLVKALASKTSSKGKSVLAIVENIRSKPKTKVDLDKYFGRAPGTPAPDVVLQVKIASKSDFAEIVKVLKGFLVESSEQIELSDSFITFGSRALLFDLTKGTRYDPSRQPQL